MTAHQYLFENRASNCMEALNAAYLFSRPRSIRDLLPLQDAHSRLKHYAIDNCKFNEMNEKLHPVSTLLEQTKYVQQLEILEKLIL